MDLNYVGTLASTYRIQLAVFRHHLWFVSERTFKENVNIHAVYSQATTTQSTVVSHNAC